MHYYNIGYYSYENSGAICLIHEKKYTEAALEKMIFKVLPDLLDKKLTEQEKQDSKYIAFCQEAKLRIPEASASITFDYLYEDIANALCERFGFQPLKHTAEYCLFSWANILDKTDWKEDRNETFHRLTNFLENNGYIKQKD